MPSALDTFRAQQEAADAVYARLVDVAGLLTELRKTADGLQRTDELKQLLERQEHWLTEARATIVEVQRWRELDARRLWGGWVARWVVAAAFAISAVAAAGAGYAVVSEPYHRELELLRQRQELSTYIEDRVLKMTPTERRQFDALMDRPDQKSAQTRRRNSAK
ncbi:MAG TPA: hypothetical protein VFA27_13050 [Vicinamibacterales bacterium]|nr:hypothetical protein [Vicinamibacterales bacterium]